MCFVGCVLCNCLSYQDKVADELLLTLNGGPVPLGSLRWQFETDPDTPGHSPLANREGEAPFSPTWAIFREDL